MRRSAIGTSLKALEGGGQPPESLFNLVLTTSLAFGPRRGSETIFPSTFVELLKQTGFSLRLLQRMDITTAW